MRLHVVVLLVGTRQVDGGKADNLLSMINSRCDQFHNSPPPHDLGRLAFTHVPKMGGTSMQELLVRKAATTGKSVLNVRLKELLKAAKTGQWRGILHVKSTKLPENMTLTQLRKIAERADILIGHSSIAWEEAPGGLSWRDGNFSRVTLIRDPISTLQSLFRYNGGNASARIASILARNQTLQQGYDEWLRSRCTLQANGACAPIEGGATQVVTYHRPACNMPGKQSALRCAHSRGIIPDLSFNTTPDLTLAMMNLVHEYAVVGVLERREETLEVLKCRIPWLSPIEFPHSNPTAPYPVLLEDNETLMHQISEQDQTVYEVANMILSVDIACCRRYAPRS